jgi:hypothetical protein
MSDIKDSSKAIDLIQLGFSVSIDAASCEDDIESIIEAARMFNSTLILRNVPDSMLDPKSIKVLKSHSNKIIIEV